MIELRQVNLAFEEKRILTELSFALPEGQVTCLLGPSGCGKTTLLRVMGGLLAPNSGTVEGLAGLRTSFIFQEDRLLPWASALGNLTAVNIGEAEAAKALADVLLSEDLHTMPAELSGGMRRRVAIARALAYGGDCFFLDEPLRGLDPATAAPVLEAMRRALTGRTALLITHSPEEALALADVIVRVQGPPVRVLASRAAIDFEDAEALKAWLQDDFP